MTGGRSAPGSRAPREPGRARALLGAVLVTTAVLLSACGVPSASTPVALPPGQIPYHLEAGPSASYPVTSLALGSHKGHLVGFLVYFLDNDVLVPVERVAAEPTPMRALDALASGPTGSEQAVGLTSALVLFPTPTLSLEGPVTRAGVATVALDTSTASLADPVLLYEELGQIVYTLTQFCAVQEVRFTYDGAPFPAYLPNGSAPSTPVSRVDYLEIAPPARPASAHHPSCISTVKPPVKAKG